MNSERMHTDVGLGGPSIRWVWGRSLRRPLANTPVRFELPRGVKTACYCKQCTAVASTERSREKGGTVEALGVREGRKRVRGAWDSDGEVRGRQGGQGRSDAHVSQASKGGPKA